MHTNITRDIIETIKGEIKFEHTRKKKLKTRVRYALQQIWNEISKIKTWLQANLERREKSLNIEWFKNVFQYNSHVYTHNYLFKNIKNVK
jgi:heme-degrading monooxygenase HmoA